MPAPEAIITITPHKKTPEYNEIQQGGGTKTKSEYTLSSIKALFGNQQSVEKKQVIPEIKTNVPKNAKIFGATTFKELVKAEKKEKEKPVELLPGEKLIIELDKALKKDRKKRDDKKYISTLSKSINNVVDSF